MLDPVVGTTQILDNGPIGSRWNLVLLAEGYRQQELGQFAGAAEDVRDFVLATAPFDELEAAINVFRVDVASTDSSADDPAACGGPGTTRVLFRLPIKRDMIAAHCTVPPGVRPVVHLAGDRVFRRRRAACAKRLGER